MNHNAALTPPSSSQCAPTGVLTYASRDAQKPQYAPPRQRLGHKEYRSKYKSTSKQNLQKNLRTRTGVDVNKKKRTKKTVGNKNSGRDTPLFCSTANESRDQQKRSQTVSHRRGRGLAQQKRPAQCRAFFFCKLLFGAFHIFTGAGVDTNVIALVDEHGNHKGVARFHGSGFGGVGSRVCPPRPARTWLFAAPRSWEVPPRKPRPCRTYGSHHVFLHELKGVFYLRLGKRYLFVRFVVHKVVDVAVGIQIFHFLAFDTGKFELFRRVEGSSSRTAPVTTFFILVLTNAAPLPALRAGNQR